MLLEKTTTHSTPPDLSGLSTYALLWRPARTIDAVSGRASA
jgi:hypothetical protein